jgi:hypothetical protein
MAGLIIIAIKGGILIKALSQNSPKIYVRGKEDGKSPSARLSVLWAACLFMSPAPATAIYGFFLNFHLLTVTYV